MTRHVQDDLAATRIGADISVMDGLDLTERPEELASSPHRFINRGRRTAAGADERNNQ